MVNSVKHHLILAPCYNEEKVIARFLLDLEETMQAIKVVIVDDDSRESSIEILKSFRFSSRCFSLITLTPVQNVLAF
mgnify:CR=1 FL=1